VLIQRAALLHAFCESCEAKWLIDSDTIDPSYVSAVSALRHVLALLGLKRVPKRVPSLEQFIAQKYGDETST
jgi:hypothetical protein